MRRRIVVVVLAVVFAICGNIANGQAQGADPKQESPGGRKGFIIGFGLGPGYTHVSQTIDLGFGEESGSIDKFAVNTDFKIGLVASKQVLVYWNAKVAWFADEIGTFSYNPYTNSYYVRTEDAIFASGIGGIGVSYYLEPGMSSPYVTATLGYAFFSTPGNDHYDGETGFGMAAGFGYEFVPHWTIECDLVYGRTVKDPLTTGAISFKLQLGILSF